MVPAAPKVIWLGMSWPALVPVVSMLLAILLIMVARVRLLGIPFERDEGEYAYIGQLMLQGVAPYGVAANMKLPGTNAAYALIMALFGQSVTGVHFGFLLVNAGSIVLVYFLARRLLDVPAGVVAAASFAVLSVAPSVDGIWAHATQFVVLFALAAILLFVKWVESRKTYTLVWSGLLFGIAFLMKQPGILFAGFGVLYLLYSQRTDWWSNRWQVLRNLAVFGGAVMAPFGVTCLLLWRAGVFDRFWLWVFTYARQYVAIRPASSALSLLWAAAAPIVTDDAAIWLLAAAGLLVLWLRKGRRATAAIATAFLVCSFLAVCPGFYFRPHYFVLLLPALALLSGAVATWAKENARVWPLWVVAGCLAFTIWQQGGFLFQMSYLEICRTVYGSNPFPEAIPVADYIRTHSDKNDRIAILGSEPEIYFYSGRRSATPYVYVYPLMEPQPLAPRMQEEFIHAVEAERPKYIVYVNVDTSWLIGPHSLTRLLEWAKPYWRQHYDRVGVADILRDGAVYRWDGAAAVYLPRSRSYLLVLKRKADGR
jgi:hypothetical protein